MKIRIEAGSAARTHPTGVGFYVQRLAEALARRPSVQLSLMQFNFRSRQLRPNVSGDPGLEMINFPQRVYAKLDFLGIAPPLDLFLPKVDFTIFPNYALWPTVRSRKTAITIHDLSFVKFPEVVEAKNLTYLRRVVGRSIRRTDLVITVSETVKQEISTAFNLPLEKIVVTPIPPSTEYSTPSDRPVHEIYSIPTKEYILFASTIEPRKNLSSLLDAYEKLPSGLQEKYSLVIAGGMGWHSEDLQKRLERLRQKYKNIVLCGYYDQADAAALYQKASMFILPTRYEGFGMPMLEAMAASTPTITTDIPVMREVCGNASLFYQLNDSSMLARHIETLAKDRVLQARLVKAGHKNLTRYDWDVIAQNLVKKLEAHL